ncbi:MAG: MSMEG_4193 family putative phosphomutase [Nakamurella sp.]
MTAAPTNDSSPAAAADEPAARPVRDAESDSGAPATTPTAQDPQPADRDPQPDQQPDQQAEESAKEPRPPILTVVLVRHGQSTANVAGVLAGRTEGVRLNEHGEGQAAAIAERLSSARFDRLISSPLERCIQTVTPFSDAVQLPIEPDEHFIEVDYGSWSGRELKDLGAEPLWRTVQAHPSAAVFPGGEGLAGVSARAAAGIRDIRLAATKDQTVLICSHGDVIKAILADALGMHLDAFQRIVVAPASISVIRYTPLRPFVERINDTGELGSISPYPTDTSPKVPQAPTSDAVPGGVTS